MDQNNFGFQLKIPVVSSQLNISVNKPPLYPTLMALVVGGILTLTDSLSQSQHTPSQHVDPLDGQAHTLLCGAGIYVPYHEIVICDILTFDQAIHAAMYTVC